MFIDVSTYQVGMILVGAAALAAVLLPRVASRTRISYPVVYLAIGVLLAALPLPLELDLRADMVLTERLTELAVILALMGVGLKIDRPFDWRSWGTTWRLLAVTMPLTIAVAALIGWWMVGLAPAAAMLLGAVSAPTDPVLASDVQSGAPMQTASEDDVRFALTSEAGFNDGLAFPFTYAAIAAATAGAPQDWLARWLTIAVFYKIIVGILIGLIAGRGIAWLVFDVTVGETRLARTSEGLVAIAATLLAYGTAETAQGYGFLAVFFAGLGLRRYEREHEYHEVLHDFADQAERFALGVVVILLGGTLVNGLLGDMTWTHVVVGLLIAFVLRPLFGVLAMLGSDAGWRDRLIIAFFGIKGIGSLFYLSYGLENAEFPQTDHLWAIVGATVVASMIVHGVTAAPVMRRFDRWRRQIAPEEHPHPEWYEPATKETGTS